jgi:type I restriction enzyme S subunit
MKSDNWEYGTLENAVNKGSSNISLNKVKEDDGEFPLFSAKGYNKNISFFHQEKEYLAIIKDGAGIGRVSQHPAKSSVVATMQYLIPKEGFDIGFVQYFLNGIDFESHRQGSTIPHVYFKDYKSELFPLLPLTQQKQIVAILDKAFAAIDTVKANAEQNLQNAKELFESYLQNVFENKEDDWEMKTIGDIGKPSMCKRILKQQTSTDGDIPFYKIGTFGKVPNAYISKELYEEYKSKYSFPKKGDILISASGTIGRRVIYNGEPGFFQDSNIVWIDNDEKQVLNEYLYSFYGYCDWQPSKGATISRLYNANLKRIKITFPKSLQEQKKVIKKIEVLSNKTKKLEAIYSLKITDLEEMKKSILQKAFKGEL